MPSVWVTRVGLVLAHEPHTMLKALLKLSLVSLTIAGCYRDGTADPVPGAVGDETAMTPDPAASSPGSGTAAGDGPSGPAGVIDFGAEPKGAAALSNLTCPALAMPTSPATIYVDTTATGAGTGTKTAPFRTLAKAFGAARSKGVIWVAAGTYGEQLLVPHKDLTVLGGFTHDFASRTSACDTVVEAPNANAPVFALSSDVKSFAIEGLTVQKGVRGLLVLGDSKDHGSITVARCVFAENGATNRIGGAVFLESVNARIFGSVFRNNRASKGAALASSGDVKLTIDQNLFLQNLGYSDHGGGLYISASSSKISRNTFRGNATGVGIEGGWGGAVIVYSNALTQIAKADFSFNVFTENVAGIGGAVFVDDGAVVTMSHDLLYRNRAYQENGFVRGAAIYVDGTGNAGGGSTFTGEYLTVVNNNLDDKGVPAAASFGGNAYVEGSSKATFTNSIFWNNGDDAFYVAAGQNELSVSNSVGANGCTSGNAEGLITASATICKIGAGVFQPAAIHFGDEVGNDYHEKSAGGRFLQGAWVKDAVTSPAIDKADPSAPVGSEPMPNGNRANLGAFSETPEASMSP
jgi:hypothetical protein